LNPWQNTEQYMECAQGTSVMHQVFFTLESISTVWLLSVTFLPMSEQECQTDTKHARHVCGKFNSEEDLMITVN